MEGNTLTHPTCTHCSNELTDANWLASRKVRNIRNCTSCTNNLRNQHRRDNPYQTIFTCKKARAKSLGQEFTLRYEDIAWPTHCPVLGMELEYRRQLSNRKGPIPYSPSFDRIDPTKGYVPGNVIIVSHKANVIKNNATVDELERVASYYRQLIPQVGATDV